MEVKQEVLPLFPEVFMGFLEESFKAMRKCSNGSREYVLHHFAASLLIEVLEKSRRFSGNNLEVLQRERLRLQKEYQDLDPVLIRRLMDTVPLCA